MKLNIGKHKNNRSYFSGKHKEERPFRGELYNIEQLRQFAREIARNQQIVSGTRDNYLLDRLNYNDEVLERFNNTTLSAPRLHYISPATEWLIDNYYLIEEHIQLARKHFPKSYNRELPCMVYGPNKGLPRVYDIASNIILHVDAQIDEESLVEFFKAYQTESVLKLGELWAVPIMLRLVLIENLQRIASQLEIDQRDRDLANEWVDKLEDIISTKTSGLVDVISDMSKSKIPLSSAFVAEFCKRLASRKSSLKLAKNWIEERLAEEGTTSEEMINMESQQQAADQLSVSHSIKSLRFLNNNDWKNFVEEISVVEGILREDPANIYSTMDFTTRDYYRHTVESLAQRSPYQETEIARETVDMARNAMANGETGRCNHVGYYLVDDGLNALKKTIGVKQTLKSKLRSSFKKHPLLIYLGSITILTLAATLGFMLITSSPGMPMTDGRLIGVSIVFLIYVSQLAVFLVNWLVNLFVKPRMLPRLDFSEGINPDCKTIVVIPTMITREDSIDDILHDIELHYLSNRDDQLYFALLTDFADSNQEMEDNDQKLLDKTRKGIERLNQAYAEEGKSLFYLFHRPRLWNPGEEKWMGYERKRGKLMAFNIFLTKGITDPFSIIEGNIDLLDNVKYVITLDTDTQLPPETAYKMIGTMAHPLNQPVFDPEKNVVVKGYGILQPRVGINLTSSRSSGYSRLFTDDSGVDPYTRCVSDVYQDLFREGSFIGKGIYDVMAFEKALNCTLPENKILSHDLLESSYTRSGLVTDVEIYENYPSGFISDAKRRHRWIRGDWQIIQWIFPRVPSYNKGKIKNPISGVNKWKIADNLRRSLVPPATLIFLVSFCLVFPQYVWIALALLIAVLLVPFIVNVFTSILRKSKDQSWKMHFREVIVKSGHPLKQALFSLMVLPYDAYCCLDAIFRTLWRLLVSRKHLLQWQVSADADRTAPNTLGAYYRQMWFSPFFALLCGLLLGLYNPVLLYALPFLIAWFIAPLATWYLSRPVPHNSPELTREHHLLLHRIARKTWLFFEEFVNERENWLPPDNFQEIPVPTIASRTSPTNIGISLLANLAAYDFGYLSAGALIERSNQTLTTITKLQKYRGHLYNWYDTRTLEPLHPLYVSSVDSGNLAGHLIILAQGLKEIMDKPVYSPVIFNGLLDTVRVMRYIDPKLSGLEIIEEELTGKEPHHLFEAYLLLISVREKMNLIKEDVFAGNEELLRWRKAFLDNCEDYFEEMLYLAPWIRLLEQYSLEDINDKTTGKYLEDILALQEVVYDIPTLREMEKCGPQLIPHIENILGQMRTDPDIPSAYITYFTDWLVCVEDMAERAEKRMRILNVLAMESERFADMDFAFLYNPVKKLFTIGFNVEEQRADSGSYDMLASEARLCSYVAIAQGQIPQEHWFSLGRLLIMPQGKPILMSWSGSMFEYLMPLLVMPNFEQTLFDQTYKGVVQEQIDYAKKFNVPWGISESGLNRTDTQFNYQYQAFGIPRLGLKRGLSKDLVIAPYATLLALMVAPRKASENLQRLTKEGHEGVYGYYEAIDYTPSHLPLNETSVDVRSFMAHHQGMGLLSLLYLIKKTPMQERFSSCAMFKAYELLLQERIPHGVTANVISDDSKFEIEGLHPLQPDKSNVSRAYRWVNTKPEVNLLSNGRYQLMINNSGAGYSRWHNLAVTRWREDGTGDNRGMFIYLRDNDTGEFWSVGYQPTLEATKNYEAKFSQAYSEFHHQNMGLDVFSNICVSPEDDVELRCITLSNRSHKPRTIEITSYTEIVMAPQDADESHPVFSNLFVQTRFDPKVSTLFCARRARSEEEKPPHLIHLMLTDSGQESDISFETDRSRFIGRGNTPLYPQAMRSTGPLSGSEGSVLDPIVSLRRYITILPGKKVTVCVALGIAETEEAALALAQKYQNKRMTDRAFELAWTHSQVVLYQLNISEAEAQLFAKLAGALVYMNPVYRADPAVLKNNRRGQNGLWGYGISGDVPLVVVRITDSKGLELIRQLILAHAYWRMKGLTVELVVLNEDTSIYRHPLQDEITNLITTGVEGPLLNKPGGIFVRPVDQIPAEDVLLLQSVARLVFTDQQGNLFEQLAKDSVKEPKLPVLKPVRSNIAHHNNWLPPRDLLFENGFGGFTPDGREYVITIYPGTATPAPWCNVIANPNFGTVISESGSAYSWAENAHEFRITPWNNDPVQDNSGEAIYIRDEVSGRYWSPTPLPARGETPYVVRHGFGYSVFEHSENGIDSELWVYVAIDAPVKFSVLKLRNTSGRPRRLSVTGYYEWVLGDRRSKSLLHVQTEVDPKTGVLLARNFYNTDFPGKIAFIDAGKNRTVTGDRREFIGYNRTLKNPAAMESTRLSGKTGAGFDPCGAVQVIVDLAEGEEKEARFLLGFAHHKDDMHHMVYRFRQTGECRDCLEKVWEYWNRTLGTVNFDTPDPSVNVMSNGWLLYQALSSRIWARSGFYQSGGAFGFRDQLQDVMALVHAEPAIVRHQILLAARHQYTKGDVQHWWHPPTNRGVRTHFSDDYLWLPYVTCRYINTVEDMGILDEVVHFIEGRELRPDEESYYDLPLRSEESATLYEHCVRSIRYGLKFGVHGLPLMGSGDWNDGMNLVGKDGKGESVWLAFFLYDVLIKFSDIAKRYNDQEFADHCRDQAGLLRQNIAQNGWDGEWYRRAYFDNGEPLGSKENEECRIDSIPQSWSVISGAGDPERSASGMAQVDMQLVDRQARLIRLFYPAFDKTSLNPGYIKGYIPGVRENGGQYTHAAIWTAMAFALAGDTTKAWELFDLINPVQHGNSPERTAIYKVEPYVVAADVYSAPQHLGRGGWTWYTGSASLMYMLLAETLMGVNRAGNKLKLTPALRPSWDSYKVHYRYYSTVYHITIHRIDDNSSPRLLLDGKVQPVVNELVMADDRIEHFVDLWVI